MITKRLWKIEYTIEEDETKKTDPLWQKIGKKKKTAKEEKSEWGEKKTARSNYDNKFWKKAETFRLSH